MVVSTLPKVYSIRCGV